MAAPAIHHGRVDRDVGFHEGVRLLIVALSAERRNRIGKQTRLRRGMRQVARQTIARCRRVLGVLVQPFPQVLVACQAHIRGLRQEQFGEF